MSCPEFEEITGTAVVAFRVLVGATVQIAGEATGEVTPQVLRALKAAGTARSFPELQAAAGLKDRVHFLKSYLEPLLRAGWIERTIPDKPRSSKQKYRLTEKGRQALQHMQGADDD